MQDPAKPIILAYLSAKFAKPVLNYKTDWGPRCHTCDYGYGSILVQFMDGTEVGYRTSFGITINEVLAYAANALTANKDPHRWVQYVDELLEESNKEF